MNAVIAAILACLHVSSVEDAIARCRTEIMTKTETHVVARVTCSCVRAEQR